MKKIKKFKDEKLRRWNEIKLNDKWVKSRNYTFFWSLTGIQCAAAWLFRKLDFFLMYSLIIGVIIDSNKNELVEGICRLFKLQEVLFI